ncbi:MAG: S8 family serine peptidase [Ignavibacteriae bacterium]|nr:S8 family serine peptidase [Ignavibacteriota bacterium]
MSIIDIPSPHYTRARSGYRPEAVVIHIMAGTLPGTDAWFRNPQSKVSAHYGIGRTGTVHRYVQEADTAWHAGRVHGPTWGGLHPAPGGGYVNPNFYTIGIEHEGSADSEWTDAMYEASAALVADICTRWNIPVDRAHIIGHREIYSVKSCPGTKVDLERLILIAGARLGAVPAASVEHAQGTLRTTTTMRLRRGAPNLRAPVVRVVPKGETLAFAGMTDHGELVQGVSRWYQLAESDLWIWGGGVDTQVPPGSPALPWWLRDFGISSIWERGVRGAGIRVAILDSGINRAHPDLQDALPATAVRDFIDTSGDGADEDGHGTHCAGIIAGRGVQSVLGVAPGCELLIGKIMRRKGGTGSNFQILADALYWVVDSGADLISLSLSTPSDNALVRQACTDVIAAGVPILTAIGNSGAFINAVYPASYPGCLGVGSVDRHLLKDTMSAESPAVQLLAPGSEIISTALGQGTTTMSGTSMATAYAAGVLALLLSAVSSATGRVDRAARCQQALLSSCLDLATPGTDTSTGHGLIQPTAALSRLI